MADLLMDKQPLKYCSNCHMEVPMKLNGVAIRVPCKLQKVSVP